MDKSKRDMMMAGVLVLAFLFFAGRNLLPSGRGVAGPQAAAQAPLDLSFLAAARQNAKTQLAQEAVWEKEWARDPFLPAGSGSSSTGGQQLTLSGVVWDDKTPLAMVNDKVLGVGDVLGGYRIVQIKPSSIVVLSEAGQTVEIELFKTYGAESA